MGGFKFGVGASVVVGAPNTCTLIYWHLHETWNHTIDNKQTAFSKGGFEIAVSAGVQEVQV